jgi:hypothetical protein
MRLKSVIWPAIGFVLAASCSTAKSTFETTWTNPADTTPVAMTGKKVVVIAMNLPNAMRMGVESSIAADLRGMGANAKGAYEVLAPGSTIAAAKEKLLADGYDSAFVVRLVDNEEQLWARPGVYEPGKSYQSYWEWGGGWGKKVDGELPPREKAYVETLVYSIRRDELAFGGVSVTSTKPDTIAAFCRDLVQAAVQAMKRSGRLV